MRKGSKDDLIQTQRLIQSWIAEAERKLLEAERLEEPLAAAHLRGKLDGFKDCLVAIVCK